MIRTSYQSATTAERPSGETRSDPPRLLRRIVLLFSTALIVTVTFLPGRDGGSANPFPACIACGPGWFADFLANILLFVPLGFALRFEKLRLGSALLLVASATVTVELVQAFVLTGRHAAYSDLIANSIGGLSGYVLLDRYRSLVMPRANHALLFMIAWCSLWLGGTVVTAWSHTPSLPPTLWWSHWPGHDNPNQPRQPGEPVILFSAIGDVPVPHGLVDTASHVRELALSGAPVHVRAIFDHERSGTSRIYIIDDADTESELFAFSRAGDAIVFSSRTRANSLRLRNPSVASPRLGLEPGDTVHMSGSLQQGVLRLEVSANGQQSVRTLALSPNLGWSLLLPSYYPMGSEAIWGNALWLAVLVFPIAFWGAQANAGNQDPTYRSLLALACISSTALTLLFLPRIFGIAPPGALEWFAWLASMSAGWLLGGLVSSRVHEVSLRR